MEAVGFLVMVAVRLIDPIVALPGLVIGWVLPPRRGIVAGVAVLYGLLWLALVEMMIAERPRSAMIEAWMRTASVPIAAALDVVIGALAGAWFRRRRR